MSVGFRFGFAALLALLATGAAAADYANACGICHQANGQGVPDAFPPLAGHAPTVLAQPGGRDYLVHLVLYGLQGQIAVNGKTFNGMMPPWGEALNDEQLAGALD